jgi:hypothetical protein
MGLFNKKNSKVEKVEEKGYTKIEQLRDLDRLSSDSLEPKEKAAIERRLADAERNGIIRRDADRFAKNTVIPNGKGEYITIKESNTQIDDARKKAEKAVGMCREMGG